MKLTELFEDAVGAPLSPKQTDIKTAVSILNKHCKDALWMLEKGRPIWRGDDNMRVEGFALLDASKSVRKSKNTSNYYTVLLDNNPYNQPLGFPKRSKSLICSTSYSYASDYSGDVYAIIPFDGVPIGCVNEQDMWDTMVRLFKTTLKISNWNDVFKRAGINESIGGFNQFAKALADDADMVLKVQHALAYWDVNPNVKDIEAVRKNFMDYLFKAYSSKQTGHTVATTKTLPKGKNQEVWVGGKCVVISESMWQRILMAHRSAPK